MWMQSQKSKRDEGKPAALLLMALFLLLLAPEIADAQSPESSGTESGSGADYMEECKQYEKEKRSMCMENGALKNRLMEAQTEIQARDVRIATEEKEKQADRLRLDLEQSRSSIVGGEMERERLARREMQLRMDILKGNLLYPGWGEIRDGRKRGWVWLGGFSISLAALLVSYYDYRQKERSYFASYDLSGEEESAYRNAFQRTRQLTVLPLLFYGISLGSALQSHRSFEPVAGYLDHTGSRQDLAFRLEWRLLVW